MPRKPAAPKEGLVTFTNKSAHTTVHLGDGRKVAPGESAEVSAELAALLAK